MGEVRINPNFITDYFLEKVNNEYPYKDNKFTFLTNISDDIYYIFEEFYISSINPITPGVDPGTDDGLILHITTNVTGVTVTLLINNSITKKITLSGTQLDFKSNFKEGDIISYSATKTGYTTVTDQVTLPSDGINIVLERINSGNPETTIGKIKFKTNYIGTTVSLTYININEETIVLYGSNRFLNSTIDFDVINCVHVSYEAHSGSDSKSDNFDFSTGEKIINLVFSDGENNNNTGGSEDGGEVPSTQVNVTGIIITPKTLTLHVGESYQLSAQVLPANATNKTVYWTLLDENGQENEFTQLPNQTITFDWGTLTGPFEYSQKTSSTAKVLLYGRYLEELVVTMKINSTYSNSYYIERGTTSQGSTFTNIDEGSNTQKTITFKLVNAANGGSRVSYYITENGKEYDASGTVQVGTGTCYINTIGDIYFMCEAVWESEYHLTLTSTGASNTTITINNENVQAISKTITYEETLININIDTNLPGVIYIKKNSGNGTAYFVLDGHTRNGAEITTSDIGLSYGTESFGIRIPRNDTSNEKNIILRVYKKFLSINYEFGIVINQTSEAYENAEAKIIWGNYGNIDEYYDTVFYGDTVRNIQVKVQSNCDWEFHDKYYYNNVTISPASGSVGTTDITITTEAYDSGVPKLLTSTLYLVHNGNRDNDKELDSIYRYQLAKNTTGSHSSYPQAYPVWISAQVIDGSSSNTSFNAMELNTYFAVYSFTECSVYTNDSWLSIVGQSTFGIGLHLFKVHGDANNTGSRRYGTIYAKVINDSRLNAEDSISISQETNTSDVLLEYRKIMLNPSEDTVTFNMYYSKSGTIKEEKSFYVYAGDPAQSSLTSLTETGSFPGTKTITITMDPGLTAIAIYDSDNNYVTATYIERISSWEVSYYNRLR